MSTVPQTKVGRIEFFEEHLPVWGPNVAAIGIEPSDILDLSNLVDEARAAYETAHASRNQAKADTEAQDLAIAAMYDLGADLIKTIRAYAQKTNNPTVYQTAQIPAPKPPSPVGPPEQPTEVAAKVLLPFGIGLTWKGSVASGAYFGVFRKLPGETSFSLLKTTGEKNYNDSALPAGVARVDYYIAAMRDDYQVNSSSLEVRFGPDGEASTTLSMAA